jgi:hypothetical protein
VVTAVIAIVIVIFCIALRLADHPAALAAMASLTRVIDVMTRVSESYLQTSISTSLCAALRASEHSTPI